MASPDEIEENTNSRRDFLGLVSLGTGCVAAGVAIWPFVDSMNPSADVLALSSTEVDVSGIEVGQSVTISWRGKPVFIRRRTPAEIEDALSVQSAQLIDPEEDTARTEKSEWLIVVGVCTHLGCIPLGQKPSDNKGEYDGWFCPCHGSHYDSSGRIRKGPAPRNLEVPAYTFLSDSVVKIG